MNQLSVNPSTNQSVIPGMLNCLYHIELGILDVIMRNMKILLRILYYKMHIVFFQQH